MYQPYILLAILLITLGLFIWGSWRYEIVALFALVLSLLTGVVQFNQAFTGFSSPAVITVGCIMVLTTAIMQSGILSYFTSKIELLSKNNILQISFFTITSAILSAFMNNVGSLGLMMPVAIHAFIKSNKSPSIILIPLAFSSVLGGLITAIGTPPNLLISEYRQSVLGASYNMFDFTPVGLIVAFFGVLFISVIGWRLVPIRKASKTEDLFQIHDYMTEIKIPKGSQFDKMKIKEFLNETKIDFDLIAIIRSGAKTFSYKQSDVIRANDTLMIAASHENLEKLLASTKFTLVGEKPISTKELTNDEMITMESVVLPGAFIQGQSSSMLKLRTRYKINLLALSRKGISFRQKLHDIRFSPGDIVLLQGPVETLRDIIVDLGFLPLAERDVKIGLSNKKRILPLLIFLSAIALATLQILPIAVAFLTAILALIILKVIPVHNIFRSIDWSVLLLLAAIIPVGGAIESTGAADMISNTFITIAGQYSPWVALVVILIVTMTLSDLMNNAATAIIMAPIAVKIAEASNVSADPFLMAVAIGASCSFLTPIAHQNNTMVMGPGGYRFFDYTRLGLPLELIVLIVGVPAILWFWPL